MTDITGPSRDIRASVSAISFKNIPRWPGTHTNRTRLKFGGVNNLNVLATVVSEDEISDVHTDSESVTITTVEYFEGSFRRAKITAASSARNTGVKSGRRIA